MPKITPGYSAILSASLVKINANTMPLDRYRIEATSCAPSFHPLARLFFQPFSFTLFNSLTVVVEPLLTDIHDKYSQERSHQALSHRNLSPSRRPRRQATAPARHVPLAARYLAMCTTLPAIWLLFNG